MALEECEKSCLACLAFSHETRWGARAGKDGRRVKRRVNEGVSMLCVT